MIICDYVFVCSSCDDSDVIEHSVEIGERPCAAQLPPHWISKDGKLLCPKCETA